MEWTTDAEEPVTVPTTTDDGSRSVDEEASDPSEGISIDRPIETPEADLLDQLREVRLDDADDH